VQGQVLAITIKGTPGVEMRRQYLGVPFLRGKGFLLETSSPPLAEMLDSFYFRPFPLAGANTGFSAFIAPSHSMMDDRLKRKLLPLILKNGTGCREDF
jgi:hypothetical protein